MKKKNQLPEGYTPIEYIEYHPKDEQYFAYGRFERGKDALDCANRINERCNESVCRITLNPFPNDILFSIVVPERVFAHFDEIRKEDCVALTPPVPCDYNTPILYRFMEDRFVDKFFDCGELKLTTFEKCKNLEDSNRKDEQEGRSDLWGYDGNYSIQVGFGVGSDAIMLCSSLCSDYKDDKGVLFNKCIEIFDVQGLLASITEQLTKNGYIIKRILYGPCFYSKKEFHKKVDITTFKDKLDKEQVFDWDEMNRLTSSIGGDNMFFQKPIEKRYENEFRLLWIVDNIKQNQDILITIPNPQAYCRPFLISK